MIGSADKIKVAVTGAGGQLGVHCRAWLQYHFGFAVVPVDRNTFNDSDALRSHISDCQFVVHLAGVNRGSDDDVANGNLEIAQKLIDGCAGTSRAPHLIYASSIQVENSSAYGVSKRKAGALLEKFCSNTGRPFVNLVLPNLFGEFSRPHYNNFIGTFCHQIARDELLNVNAGAEVQLMHYGEVARLIGSIIEEKKTGTICPSGQVANVADIAEKLQAYHATYKFGVFPPLANTFDINLFNALRQEMFAVNPALALTRHSDDRGAFFECVRAEGSGQTSLSTTVPGIVRGNHFHFNKVERFLVMSGAARISIRRLYDQKVQHFDVSGEDLMAIDMPTLHTHNITNTGDRELLTLFWTNDFFDPGNPDTYPETV